MCVVTKQQKWVLDICIFDLYRVEHRMTTLPCVPLGTPPLFKKITNKNDENYIKRVLRFYCPWAYMQRSRGYRGEPMHEFNTTIPHPD